MANYSSNLKTWGSTGQEYPDGYSYAEGEQPVDAWDNFLTSGLIDDTSHLISLTNDRLESDAGSSHPSSPEAGHLSWRTDAQDLFVFDSTNSTWHRLLEADTPVMGANLDLNGFALADTTGSDPTISGNTVIDGAADIDGARLDHKWFSKQEGGTVTVGNSVVLLSTEVPAGSTFAATQAHLSQDGFNNVVASGIDLEIIVDGESNPVATIFSGDGSTFHESTGNPVASYTNNSGGPQQVAVAIDNGDFNAGSGSDQEAYGGAIARVY